MAVGPRGISINVVPGVEEATINYEFKTCDPMIGYRITVNTSSDEGLSSKSTDVGRRMTSYTFQGLQCDSEHSATVQVLGSDGNVFGEPLSVNFSTVLNGSFMWFKCVI